MSKIDNDKYYTDIELANYCWDKTMEIIGEENISEIIEPSCGNGSFYHHDKYVPHFGYDISPEFKYKGVIKSDFLKEEILYLYGRLIIGNPPYGERMNMAQKFFKKSVNICDYIAFILPISQYNNNKSLYEFDLIYSEDLGVKNYSGKKIHCCFNIYRRPENLELNKRKKIILKEIKITRQDSKKYKDADFDIRMCYWGNSCAGKILKDDEHYSAEYKIKIMDDNKKDEIIKYLKNYDWEKFLKFTAMKKIEQHHIIKIIYEEFYK